MYKGLLSFLYSKRKIIAFCSALFLLSFVLGIIYPGIFPHYQEKLIGDILTGAEDRRLFGLISYIIFTNLKASLLGAFTGLAFGLVPLGLLVLNGYLIGAVTSKVLNTGIENFLFSFLPHGIFEIPAAIISYTLGIWIGLILIEGVKNRVPWKKLLLSLLNAYKRAFWVYLCIIVPLLLIAGVIEGILYRHYFTLAEFFLSGSMKALYYSVFLLYLFYFIVKMLIVYKREWDMKYLFILSIAFVAASYLWMKAYGLRVEQFLATFVQILIFVPLGLFLLYSYFENKRRKEEAAKMQIKNAFKQYVAPEIIEEILKDPNKLKLGGAKKELTIFFSDIRGFTTISEKFKPEELVHFLNEYLSAMSNIVLKNKGVIDKYIGDAIMAFWGAPIEEKDNAKLACETSLEMQIELEKLNDKLSKKGYPHLNIGMGMNTGEVIVGNMGSNEKFDYTVIGDNVNLASRLEGLNKIYGTSIIISETTYEKVKNYFLARDIDLVRVKGKTQPVRIYELIGKISGEKAKIEHLTMFNEALKEYRKQKFSSAQKLFKKISEKYSSDNVARIYIDRCIELNKKSPGKNWDGVFEHHEK